MDVMRYGMSISHGIGSFTSISGTAPCWGHARWYLPHLKLSLLGNILNLVRQDIPLTLTIPLSPIQHFVVVVMACKTLLGVAGTLRANTIKLKSGEAGPPRSPKQHRGKPALMQR